MTMKLLHKRIIAALLLNILLFTAGAHELKVARFEIGKKADRIVCHVRVDRVEMLKAINSELSVENLQQYTGKHLQIAMDGRKLTPKVLNYELFEEYLRMEIDFGQIESDPLDIQVKNDFLVEQVHHHTNNVFFQLHGKSRSFQMNEERKEIEVRY